MKLIKKAAAVATVALGIWFVVGSPAMASAPPPVHADTTDTSTLTLAAPLVTIIVSVLIPLLNGILTKVTTRAGIKAAILIILNAVSALIINGMVSDGSSTFSSTTIYNFVLGTVISIATYVGVYKPIQMTSNQGGHLANVGIK